MSTDSETYVKAATDFIGAMKEVASKYGEPAYNLAMEATRIKAVNNSIIPLVVFMLFAYVTKRLVTKIQNTENKYDDSLVFLGVLTVLSALTAIISLFCTLNAAAWVGLFNPEVYAAYAILYK